MRVRAARGGALVVFIALAACGDESPSASRDVDPRHSDPAPAISGSKVADPPLPEPAVAPATPVLPELLPCPRGWMVETKESDEGAVSRCAPWPEHGDERCAIDEGQFPGSPHCKRLGPICPAEWPAIDARAQTLFVKANAAAGGSSGLGTR